MDTDPISRTYLAPHATLEVEQSGNIVLVTPERRITITNVALWIGALEIGKQAADAVGLKAL
jgi:hypothetical protein